MTLIKKTQVIFDASKEYVQAWEFEQKNPDYTKSEENTVAIVFTKEETYFIAKKEIK